MALILLVALRFVLLLLWILRAPIRTQTSIAAAAVYVVESLAFLALSKAEHNHAIRPSSLLNLYLIFSIGLDFVRMRTCKLPPKGYSEPQQTRLICIAKWLKWTLIH